MYVCVCVCVCVFQELNEVYKGSGEKTTSEAAGAVGLRLPDTNDQH